LFPLCFEKERVHRNETNLLIRPNVASRERILFIEMEGVRIFQTKGIERQ
jgi:hypothetical protein